MPARTSVQPTGGLLANLPLHGLLLVTVLAPLPLGANREWAWTLLAVALAGLIPLFLALNAGRLLRTPPRLPWLACGLFLGVCGFVVVQTSAGTPPDWQHPLWAMANEALVASGAGEGAAAGWSSISLAPDDSWVALMRLLSYGGVFLLVLCACSLDGRARVAVLWWLSIAGLAYALFGLLSFWQLLPPLPWFADASYQHDVRATFVNRNHFATWLGLCTVCALALMQTRFGRQRNPAYQLPGLPRFEIERLLRDAWPWLATLMLLLAALVLTHSRAGFFSLLAGLGLMLLCLRQRPRVGGLPTRLVLTVVLALAAAVFWLTSEVLLRRVDLLNADYATRLNAYALAADGVEDNPLLGYGYGTFGDSFRLYRDESVEGWLDKAHNTWLENIFELGWPAAVALFTALGLLFLDCLRGLRDPGRNWLYPAIGIAATGLVATHSLFDFSLQIPATAWVYAALMGVACARPRG